jgi:hypothetical protein
MNKDFLFLSATLPQSAKTALNKGFSVWWQMCDEWQ